MSRGPARPPTELEPLIGRFVHEAQRPRANEALKSLQKIASMVKPIMRTRNWYVGTLTEFYPSEAGLLGLNINHGQEIRLRLRYPGDANQFLPFEQVVDTMLHELSHIVFGPHDQKFHALWDKLRDEHEALLRQGYTGEGFLGRGIKLGGSGNIPMDEARRKARAAAEKRKTLNAGSGRRLGGSEIRPRNAQEARDRILAAVDRRKVIEKGCGVGTNEDQIEATTRPDNRNTVTTKAPNVNLDEETMMKAFIELIQEEERKQHGDSYVPATQDNPSGLRTTEAPLPISPNLLRAQQVSLESELNKAKFAPAQPTTSSRATPTPPPQTQPSTWPCPACTFINTVELSYCEVCEGPRPTKPTAEQAEKARKETPAALAPRLKSEEAWARIKAQEDAKNAGKAAVWECKCGQFNEQMWWSCQACGSVKTSS